jgi:Flp pilus assembly protein TadG
MIRSSRRRRGATVVEAAVIYPLTFLILIGLIVGGFGIFRYQQVSALARRAARWASVHGGQYAQDTGNGAATANDVYQQAVLPNAVGLDTSRLTCAVSWNPDNWPSHVTTDTGTAAGSTVTVTVSYTWVPEAYLGSITLSSTSVVPMEY